MIDILVYINFSQLVAIIVISRKLPLLQNSQNCMD